ncbi:MAG: isochorismatase family protein [Planctomycetes bacterium]|nr:isochorismatase family protein [Planctomycetota bacterium]
MDRTAFLARFQCIPSVIHLLMLSIGFWLISPGIMTPSACGQSSPRTTPQPAASTPIRIALTKQTEVAPGTQRFHRITESSTWEAKRIAVIVCDVWDSHHCLNAVWRVNEVAPRIDRFVDTMRRQGATIIHAPSECMPYYATHAARLRSQSVPISAETPEDIADWCDQIPAEQAYPYPVDQSDGGEDDEPIEHAQWHETLRDMGRNPKAPWHKQTELIQIDEASDYISDSGKEIWSILASRGIEHVMLCGIHTNMCVLGRPFGLRQLNAHGIHAVLVRDLTDTMYNPLRWPYVNHFSGTDAVIDYIERTVCETMTSDQILGDRPYRFSSDDRPHWAILIAEDEYKTEETLGRWATEHLAKDFRVSLVYSASDSPNQLRGLNALDDADALIVSVRRRPLPEADLEKIRRFIASGRPVLGIRTASHAFSLRHGAASPGLSQWPEFDSQVFGGNYTNHHGNHLPTTVSVDPQTDHPLIETSDRGKNLYVSKGSLYRVEPLRAGTKILWYGLVEGEPAEPVAWTFVREDSGKSFYTSLGHASDFERDEFCALLMNACYWLTDRPKRVTPESVEHEHHRYRRGQGKQR